MRLSTGKLHLARLVGSALAPRMRESVLGPADLGRRSEGFQRHYARRLEEERGP